MCNYIIPSIRLIIKVAIVSSHICICQCYCALCIGPISKSNCKLASICSLFFFSTLLFFLSSCSFSTYREFFLLYRVILECCVLITLLPLSRVKKKWGDLKYFISPRADVCKVRTNLACPKLKDSNTSHETRLRADNRPVSESACTKV